MKKAVVLWMLVFLMAAHAARAADDYADLVRTNLDLRQQLDTLESKYSNLGGERDVLISRIKELQRNNDLLSKQSAAGAIDISQADLEDLKKKLDEASKKLDGTAKDRDSIKKQLDAAQKKLEGMDDRIISEVQKRVKSIQAEKTGAITNLQKQNATLKDEIDRLKGSLEKEGKLPPQNDSRAATQAAPLAGTEDSKSKPSGKQIKTRGAQNMDISAAELMEAQIGMLENELRIAQAKKDVAVKGKKEAESRLKEFKRINDKERMDMHFNLAVVYEKNGMFADAEREYYKCLQIDSKDAEVHYNLGILYDDKMNKTSAALEHYRRYLELRPKGEDSSEVRGWIFNAEQEARLGVEAK